MSTEWEGVLRDAWTDLMDHPAQAREYRTRQLPRPFPFDAYASLRAADDGLCLLIRGEASSMDDLFEVGGMRLASDRDERGAILVLSLEDSGRADLFTTICADALNAAGQDRGAGFIRFLDRLSAWRRFLRQRNSGLSRQETIGLTGELLFLEQLLELNEGMLESWKAPEDGLHDFEREGHAVEIKTSLGPSTVIRISTLDQLDSTGTRRLDLVHVRLIEDPNGRTLTDIVVAIDALLPDGSARRSFANALLRTGLSPDDEAKVRFKTSVRSLEAYGVDDSFPRLLRASVPAAVSDAVYSLELRSIAGHAIDAAAVSGAFVGRL